MVRITEELVRKRAEHNECIIGTLEELTLHQENIEKIEHLHNWCKDLQILYLQSNLIAKIENLNKLKKLQYLNLAINNIEIIENLQRCESLSKLDLTLNFIGCIESVKSLQDNLHLQDLYLTGNPCADFPHYREYVITILPQLKNLDSVEITKSERIKALQVFKRIEKEILKAQNKYLAFRNEQKKRLENYSTSHLTDEEYWKSTSENAPECRVEMATRSGKNKEPQKEEIKKKRPVRLFAKDGRPLNVNEAKLDFKFSDENPEFFLLDLSIYKFLDTNLIDVDVQPTYVKVTVKGKIFQMVLPEEVFVDKSTAQRSQTTGHLVLKLVKVNYKELKIEKKTVNKIEKDKYIPKKREYLEIETNDSMDFSKIVENNEKQKQMIDYPDIPTLEFG